MNDSPAPPPRTPVWRRLLASPVVWGSALLLLALWSTIAVGDLGLVEYLLMLGGGWCFGFAFVNLTFRMHPRRNGVTLHVAASIAGGILMFSAIDRGFRLDGLPEFLKSVVVVLQMAATPAIGWTWLTLLGRVSAFSRGTRRTTAAPEPPSWQADERGGSVVNFRAVQTTMRTLMLSVVGIVATTGIVVILLLIAMDGVVLRLGARLTIIIVGVAIVLPVSLAFSMLMRRRAGDCALAFGSDELRVATPTASHSIPFHDLAHLRWRTDSDYARVEIRGRGADVSLIVGLAKPPAGFTAGLPDIPHRVLRLLDEAGLDAERSRRGVLTFHRRAEQVRA